MAYWEATKMAEWSPLWRFYIIYKGFLDNMKSATVHSIRPCSWLSATKDPIMTFISATQRDNLGV